MPFNKLMKRVRTDMRSRRRRWAGFTLIEMLIAITIVTMIAGAVYQGMTVAFDVVRLSRIKSVANSIAGEDFEIMRNMPYNSIGLQGGIPAGSLPRTKRISRSGLIFDATTTIRNFDDPFDGQVGSSTAPDTAPADYKLVQIDLQCIGCDPGDAMSYTTTIAPHGLESSSGRGSLFVRVFNANGQPIDDAQIAVTNTWVVPNISINESTGVSGQLQLVDVPTSTEKYAITVTKAGYSTDRTYLPGASGNPNPVKRHASVIAGQLTNTSFAIDRTSTVNIQTVNELCVSQGNKTLTFTGAKKIGTGPDVFKTVRTITTNGSGLATLDNLEWDTYTVAAGSGFTIGGSIPVLPLVIAPGSTIDMTLVPSTSSTGLLLTVKDSVTKLPVSGATVVLTRGSNTYTDITGQGFVVQTDWSGGGGQQTVGSATRFFSTDGNIDIDSPVGQLTLQKTGSVYAAQGQLISSVFDTGTTSSFGALSYLPADQPAGAGANSVRFQIAASNDSATTTWNYVGPDGTSATYFTTSGASIPAALSGNRYVRYKLFLGTASSAVTPTISDVSVTFSTSCTPPGQVFYGGIATGTYSVSITHPDYQSYGGQIQHASGQTITSIELLP